MTNIYLELDEKEAKFFEYSKEAKAGFEEHKSTNSKVSFRKYYKEGVKGVLKYINERNDEFPTGVVKKLSIALDNGDIRYFLRFNIITQNGNINQFIEQLIPFLPNLKQGEAYRFFPYEMPSEYENAQGEKKTGVNKGVSIHTWDLANDTKLVKVEKAHKFGKDGDIPAIVWTKVKKLGVEKNIKDDSARLEYLYEIMQKSLIGAPAQTSQSSEPSAPETKPEAPKESFDKNEHDDLPF